MQATVPIFEDPSGIIERTLIHKTMASQDLDTSGGISVEAASNIVLQSLNLLIGLAGLLLMYHQLRSKLLDGHIIGV